MTDMAATVAIDPPSIPRLAFDPDQRPERRPMTSIRCLTRFPTRWTLGAAVLCVAAAHAQTTPMTPPMTEGEVRKVDLAQAKVTLKHGPIENLDMSPMTMVFKVADPKLLAGLKDGDTVRFRAELVGGALTVTTIEPAPR